MGSLWLAGAVLWKLFWEFAPVFLLAGVLWAVVHFVKKEDVDE